MQLHSPPPNGFGASAYGPRGRQQAHGERWLGAGAPAQGSGRGSRAEGSASRRGPRLAGASEPRRRATGDARESGPGFARNRLERFSRRRGVHGCASLRDEDDGTWRDAPGSRPLRCRTVGSGLGRHLRRLAGLARRAGRCLAKGGLRSENPEPGTGRPCVGHAGSGSETSG